MTTPGIDAPAEAGPEPRPLPLSDFQEVPLQPSYSTGEQPLTRFYVPLLARAKEYRRLVGYFNAAVLARAAAGFAPFVARRGQMQLVVGAQLSEEDVDAVLRGEPLDRVVADRLRLQPLTDGVDIVQREHLRLFAWMLREGLLEMRVGVPVDALGKPLRPEQARRYFHSKYGLFTDELGRQIAFSGSDNETVAGWTGNHETFHVYWSWNDPVWALYGADVVRRLDQHWTGTPDSGWAVMPVPEAVREQLVSIVPPGWDPPLDDADPRLRDWDVPDDPLGGGQTDIDTTGENDPDVAERQRRSDLDRLIEVMNAPLTRTMVGVASAGVEPLPHQQLIAVRAVETYPRGYLLADEVGLGKTIEAGLILRELLLSGRAKTALLLVPASVLRQWQEELHEKIALDVPRYEGGAFLDRHNRPLSVDPSANPWSASPVLLASSHLARRNDRRTQILAAAPWDVVLVDEAHHARRQGLKSTGTPNALLSLLQVMKDTGAWKALYLASATPMQMAPHEAWDLIDLLSLPGAWAESADQFVRYYADLRRPASERDWSTLTRMLRDQLDAEGASVDEALRTRVRDELGPVRSRTVLRLHEPPPPTRHRVMAWNQTQERLVDEWLRAHTPMRDRVFRHTRATMRRYQQNGLLPPDLTIPTRQIRDEFIKLSKPERALYERIDGYISRYYNAYLTTGTTSQATRALGFIMTVYQRRLTSSFEAVRLSLTRRRDLLRAGRGLVLNDLLDSDDRRETEDADLPTDMVVDDPTADDLLGREISELDSFIADIEALGGQDTKADQLYGDLNEALSAGYDSVVLFTQYTDTMDYLRERLAGSYQRVACYSGRGGERWDPDTGTWARISKSELKQQFRDGEIRILLGTDSMSEGLNLQTCGRLFNYDMPWNLMRVEQRIGRIDRIGAAYPVVTISNYFYAGTVEQSVYAGIREDFGNFTEIVGDAQPVLAATEEAIRAAAMAVPGDDTVKAVEKAVDELKRQVRDATSGAVRLSDAERQTLAVPELHPSATLTDLAAALVNNHAIDQWLTPDPAEDGVYCLALPECEPVLVAFDRKTVDQSPRDVSLFTWGSAGASALLASALDGDN
ncbi:DEAD/DEAH box helicase [Kribbella sp. NPDC002412]